MLRTIIHSKCGDVSGIELQGYTVYKGIPYATPPVGDLRWKAPQAMERWDGVYQATEFGTIFNQDKPKEESFYHKEFYSNPDFTTPMSENSLFLNIWVPNNYSEKLPVAFWIHGGGFGGGYGHEIEFDGEAYCKKDVILVTINYRVGTFGFLAHPWLSVESSLGVSGNYGILDQMAALNWVYENIDAFGGDPAKITIFGQSAGSMSVQSLVSSPLTAGKIKGAILQSAGGYKTGLGINKSLKEAEKIGVEFAELCGAHSLEELRALPANTLVEKAGLLFVKNMNNTGIPELLFTPNVDGVVILEENEDAVDRGHIQNIPYMIGSTKNDIFCEDGEKNRLYYGCIDWSLKQEELFRKPSYVYYFSRSLPGDDRGAFHSAELWYLFGTLTRCWRPMEDIDYALSDRMISYWTNFIKTGNPNGPCLEEWKACSKNNVFVKEFC